MRTPVRDSAPATSTPKSERKPRARRRKLDLYETGEAAIEAFLSRVTIEGPVWEPCAGPGRIARALKARGLEVLTNDLDPAHNPDTCEDAAQARAPSRVKVVVTNPPFSKAFEILTNCRAQNLPCAFYLRLSFLEPTFDRGVWLHENPPDSLIVDQRYSFTGDGSKDSVTCAWMLWGFRLEPRIQIVRKLRESQTVKG